MNWRLLLTRFVVNALLIGIVVTLVPGVRTNYDVSLLDIGLIAIAFRSPAGTEPTTV